MSIALRTYVTSFKRRPARAAWRAAIEQLESRIVLTSPGVVGIRPVANGHMAAIDADIAVEFDQPISTATITESSIAVFGSQSGSLKSTEHEFNGSNNLANVTLGAGFDWFPGETVFVSVTGAVENTGGEAATPHVIQFQAETTGGSGVLQVSDDRVGRSVGTDVALGDLDGDSDVDAFVVGLGADEVWLNDGSGNFTSNGQSLGDAETREVALGDLDGDGDLDAVLAIRGANTVWINSGGSFSDSGQSLGNANTNGVDLGDVDGDGDLDAFFANTDDFGAPNRVWLNDGHALFTDSGQNLGSSSSQGVALRDVNGDGHLDAFVVNSGFFGNEPNRVWLNNGMGTFDDSGQAIGNRSSADVAMGDIDADGDIDAVFVGTTNEVWRNNGSGTFVAAGQLGTSFSGAVALADVDGDGDLDAFIAKSRGFGGAPNEVWINSGNGSFSDSGQMLGDEFSASVALDDLDGDGDVDAFVGNDDVSDVDANSLWVNDGLGSFSIGDPIVGFADTFAVALGDLDGDNDLDAFLGNFQSANQVWLNNGFGNLGDTGQSLGSSHTRAVSLGDLDGDGDLDAITANSTNKSNRVWFNDGHGRFTDGGQAIGSSSSLDVALGDVDGDGDLDAAIANAGSQRSRLWLNDGSGLFTDSGQSFGMSDAVGVAMGDLDNDGDLDVVLANASDQPNIVWLNNGRGVFGDGGQALGARSSLDVALGDVDNDGDLDAFFANTSNQPDAIYQNDGRGRFSVMAADLGNSSSRSVSLGDLDGDGDLDAFVIGVQNKVWTNVAGRFMELEQNLDASGSRSVALGDLNNDGSLDAIVAREADASLIWFNLLTPPLTVDMFEPNDSSSAATDLNVVPFSLTGQLSQTHEMLTIHESANEDWYRWTAPEDGKISVELLFSHQNGDLDLTLFNSNFNVLTRSNKETDNELATWPVVKDEDYYIQVLGFSGTTQPDYDLILIGSEFPPDKFEGDRGNDQQEDAVDLGSETQSHPDLTIHNPGNDDWFIFTPATSGPLDVDILFQNDRGDLDLTLFSQGGAELAFSSTSSDNESVSVDVVAGRRYFIQVSGFDGATNPYELRVNSGNAKPTISPISNKMIEEDGTTGTVTFAVGDVETPSDQLVVTASSSDKVLVPDENIVLVPNGLTRAFTITPAPDQFGLTTISIDVRDSDGGISTESFLLSVNPVNDAPIINSDEFVSVTEGSIIALNVDASDVDQDRLTYTITAGFDKDLFTINSFTGTLEFVVPPDFENPTDANQNNRYDVRIQVDDGRGGTDVRTFVVEVTDVNESPLTVDIADVSPDPRAGAVSEIELVFSREITGLDIADVSLTRTNDVTASLFPGSASLTTSDNITWRLTNLQSLTSDSGVYRLTLTAGDSGIEDIDGNNLQLGATDQWINGAGDANLDHEFNQRDLIRILQAEKYLTGETASWSEGDWNGDGVFNQIDIQTALQTANYLQGPFAATGTSVQAAAGSVIASARTFPALSPSSNTHPAEVPVTDAVFAELADQPSLPTLSNSTTGGLAKRQLPVSMDNHSNVDLI